MRKQRTASSILTSVSNRITAQNTSAILTSTIQLRTFSPSFPSIRKTFLSTQSRAVWEHLADVFAVVFKQHRTANEHEWRIGTECFNSALANAEYFSNLKHPGTAFRFLSSKQSDKKDLCLGHMSQMDPENIALGAYEWSTIASKALRSSPS